MKNIALKNQYESSLKNSQRSSLYYAIFALLRTFLRATSATARSIFVFFATITIIFSISIIPNAQYIGLQHIGLLKEAKADTQSENSNARAKTKQKNQNRAYENPRSKGIELNIIKATPVVTDKSGYHLTASIKATTVSLPEGTIQLSVNSNYTFVSRTDLQNWAQGESLIPTPQILGSVKISKLNAGSTSTVQFNIPADKKELQNIWNWGPKPLKITYFSNDYLRYKSIFSFLTRSNTGLHTSSSPAMKLTAVMPILCRTQYALKEEITKPNNHSGTLLQASKDDTHHILEQADLASKHEKLQTVADINTLQAARLLFTPSAYMQQSGFDISAYADERNSSAYNSAGISEKVWSSQNSHPSNQNTSSQNTSSSHNVKQIKSLEQSAAKTYAWQTYGKWTLSALEQAKRNGYNTVIATDEFDSDSSKFAVSNGVYDIPTPAGDVRVLAPQEVLTTLANGKPTSSNATSENTQAGRINRLVAQSAFYQMEQPYVERHILITFSNRTNISYIDSVMSALEKSPWLSLSELSEMAKIKQDTLPYWRKNNIMQAIPHSSAISASKAKIRQSTLKSLQQHRKDVLRFTHSIIEQNKSNHLRNTESDAQALAKQTTKSKNKISSKVWGEYLLQLYNSIALHELVNNTNKNQGNKTRPAENTSKRFAYTLLSGIRIIPPKDITAVSETASMPVTINNTYPYPVKVYLSADTHAMEIVTRRKTLVNVPANSETQITLPLRITTSTRTKATFVLEDSQHRPFSKQQSTLITSTLQISDKSGTIIIIFAFMLGLLGLWRQFHRKKDPDE